ncbi:unnamed protein product [Anisakis simplex]|uniref:Uncharacterized protein n=1 Tax=Anisakis simplex TaxID=6269 RepID=A0A0M3K6C5_ANISI|nr:unnamed protein product [Anisakis simplex]
MITELRWNVSNSLIAISNCLELSRLRTKLPDIRIVNEMRCWLMKFGDKGNKWASHSCSIIIDLIEGKRNVSCKEMALSFGSGQTTISTDLEEEIYNDASLYLQHSENIIPNTADNNQVEQISEQSASQNGDGIGRIETNDEQNGDDTEQKPNDTPDNSHYSPSLLTRLEVAAKRAVSNSSNGCIVQNASSKSQRSIFNLRDFLQLHEINKELKRYIGHDLSQNKQNGFSSAVKNEEKDLGNVIMKNQQSFEQKLDGVVKMMQEMANTTSTPSTSMPQAPIQMPSLHMLPATFIYMRHFLIVPIRILKHLLIFEEELQDKAFQMFDFLADTFQP